jgi:glycosyltransferase involved in cell wall biosynthesis
MRVLLVNKLLAATGGADVHVDLLARELERSGHEVLVFTSGQGRPSCRADHRVVRVPAPVTHGSRDALRGAARARVLGAALWNRNVATHFDALVASFRPDVIHLHKLYPQLSVAPVVVAHRRVVPVVQTLHDYEFLSAHPTDHSGSRWDSRESSVSYRVLNAALFVVKQRVHVPRVHEWVAVSRRVASLYRPRGIDPTVIPNFIGPVVSHGLRYEDRSHALYLGRLVPEKGVAEIIRLAEEAPDIPVVVAGDGPLRTDVERASARLPNLRYAGLLSYDEVGRALATARVLVAPSRWEEPGPLSVLEAFAAGTPVVTYALGGAAEYVEDAGAGLVAVETDLARSVQAIFHDENRFARLSANALRGARERHSAPAYARSILDVYTRAHAKIA